MTGVPEPMASRLALPATTLCHAWRLTRTDGIRLGFTDHDRVLTLGGLQFEPQSGMTASEARDSVGLNVDTADVAGALTSERIAAEDIDAGLYDGAKVETLLVDWTETAAHVVLRTATIGKLTRADGAFTAELDSIAKTYDQPKGRHFRRGCDADVGDGRCGVDLSAPALRGQGVVVAVLADGRIRVAGLDMFSEGWFVGGLATRTDGKIHRVASHSRRNGDVVLALDGENPPAVAGASFSVTAGCDKSFAVCRSKFANSLNFRGFPHLPGNDAVYAYATEDAVFDGAPLVP